MNPNILSLVNAANITNTHPGLIQSQRGKYYIWANNVQIKLQLNDAWWRTSTRSATSPTPWCNRRSSICSITCRASFSRTGASIIVWTTFIRVSNLITCTAALYPRTELWLIHIIMNRRDWRRPLLTRDDLGSGIYITGFAVSVNDPTKWNP
jgi:hypothetical protein